MFKEDFDRHIRKLQTREQRAKEPERAVIRRKWKWLRQQRALRKKSVDAPQDSTSSQAVPGSGSQVSSPSTSDASDAEDDWFAEMDQDDDFWNLGNL